MASQVMRITLKAYDHQLVDAVLLQRSSKLLRRMDATGERTGSAAN